MDIRSQIADLIDSAIQGKDTRDLASRIAQQQVVNALSPKQPVAPAAPVVESDAVDPPMADVPQDDSVDRLKQYFAGHVNANVDRDIDNLVDFGEVPRWLSDEYASSEFAEMENGSPVIVFGEQSSFIRFLNHIVPNVGDAIIRIWASDQYGE